MSATPTGWHAVICRYCGALVGVCCRGPNGDVPTHKVRKVDAVKAGHAPENLHLGPHRKPSPAELRGQGRLL